MNTKKFLWPNTLLGKITVIYFCIIWWILVNKPVLGIFNEMVQTQIIYILDLPINFFYVIFISAITIILTFVVLCKWDIGGES